jgi:hypothetical protein
MKQVCLQAIAKLEESSVLGRDLSRIIPSSSPLALNFLSRELLQDF